MFHIRLDRGFKPRSVKPKNIKLVFVASPLSRVKTGLLWIRIMCPIGASYLPTDSCFSEL